MFRNWIALLGLSAALAQTGPAPAFEVVSIKASTENGRQDKTTPGTIFERGETLKDLIAVAFGVKDYQVMGGPKWADSDRYDIVAKASGPADDKLLFQMLQTLLAERFHLETHRESKPATGYVLLAPKTGLKAQPAKDPDHPSRSSSNGKLTAKAVSMAQLASWLARRTGIPVVDGTGLSQLYDFEMTWDPALDRADPLAPGGGNVAASDPKGLPLALALREQTGLRLEARKVSLETIVVDRAEKPTLN